MPNKKCVVSFADGAGYYAKAMMRLELSLKQVGFDGHFKGINDYNHIGSPLHKGEPTAVPYAFKAHSIKKAIEEGHELILWCDSVVYATKPITPVFDHIKEHGYLLFDNIGFNLSEYTSDACLNKFNIDRNYGYNVPMIAACVMGFDVNNRRSREFLEQYISAASDGVSYYGNWTNNDLEVSNDMRCLGHRHDQSVASCIAHTLGMELTNFYQTYFAYVEHKGRLPISSTVCLWSAGM